MSKLRVRLIVSKATVKTMGKYSRDIVSLVSHNHLFCLPPMFCLNCDRFDVLPELALVNGVGPSIRTLLDFLGLTLCHYLITILGLFLLS